MDFYDIVDKNAENYETYVHLFQQTFKVPLRKFWTGNITGFDILAFDEFIKAGNRPLKEVVAEKWGNIGVAVIEKLCSRERETNNTE